MLGCWPALQMEQTCQETGEPLSGRTDTTGRGSRERRATDGPKELNNNHATPCCKETFFDPLQEQMQRLKGALLRDPDLLKL